MIAKSVVHGWWILQGSGPHRCWFPDSL